MSLKFWRALFVAFILILGVSSGAMAAEYESGHKALQLWNDEAIANIPPLLNIWLMFMLAVFAVGIFFIWRHPIARWLVGGFVLTLLTVMFVAPALGLPVLSGLVALTHLIFWSPGLYLLLKHKPFLAKLSPFSIWSGVITLVILVSFVFDIRDAAIYLDHMLSMGLLS